MSMDTICISAGLEFVEIDYLLAEIIKDKNPDIKVVYPIYDKVTQQISVDD